MIRSEFMGKSCPKIPYTVLESLLIAWQEEAMLSQAFSFRYVAAANCLVVGAKPGASDSTGRGRIGPYWNVEVPCVHAGERLPCHPP